VEGDRPRRRARRRGRLRRQQRHGPSYESSSRLLVGQALQASNPDVNLFQSATDLAATYAVIGESRQLLDRVRTSLKLDEPVEA
jgi:capsular polysaccharide biosynthesis protein